MIEPLFSIVVPTYNRAELLQRALRSVLQQTFQSFEVVVVDNRSTDTTREVIESLGDDRIQCLDVQNNGIIAVSRNMGIRYARGEWVCFLDSDDWWYPKKLEVASRHLSGSDIIYHDLHIYNSNGRIRWQKVKGKYLRPPVFSRLMKSGNVIVTSSVVVRKEVLEKVGGFDEDAAIVAAEDYDLWLRIARSTERFTYIPKSLGAYWVSGERMTEVSERQIERIAAVYRKHLAFLENEDREDAIAVMEYGRARILQKMGYTREAFALFRETLRARMINIKIKSVYCLALICLLGRDHEKK